MSINKTSRNAETRDLRKMDQETDNVYLTAVVISRRADQIAEKQKEIESIYSCYRLALKKKREQDEFERMKNLIGYNRYKVF